MIQLSIHKPFAAIAVAQLNNEEARQVLSRILSTDEFQHVNRRISLSEYLSNLLLRYSSYINMDRLSDIFMILMVIAGLVLVFWLVRLTAPLWKVMNSNIEDRNVMEAPSFRPTPASLLNKAEKRAAAGEFRLALRDLYLSLLYEMDNRRLISYKSAKTNFEYLSELKRNAAVLEGYFRSMVDLFDYKWYGLESCDKEDFQVGRELYFTLLREASHD